MGYLVCDKCGGYYELQPGESPDDFMDECECGGKTRFVETLEEVGKGTEKVEPTITCPKCGAENPEYAKFCKSCKKMLRGVAPAAPKSEKSKEGILETWNKQTNAIKAISIIGVCCIGIILIIGITGMFAPDKTTTSTPATITNTATTSPDTTSQEPTSKAESVEVQVNYPGEWSGAVSDSSGTRSIDGTGSKTIPVSSSGSISANAQKGDNGTGSLTISIVQGGKTVETQTTSAEYGVASVSHYF